MRRVIRGTTETLTATFSLDGVDTDPTPDTATIHITRDDGTDVVAAGTAATDGTEDGEFTFPLTAAMTVDLDVLTAVWTSTDLGTITQTIEVVGGFLFTVAQARALDPLNNVTRYTTQQIIDARTLVETALEDACGVAFVPRYRREQVSGSGFTQLMLSRPRVTAVRSVTLDGVEVDAASAFVPSGPGTIYYPASWTRGFNNYDIAYEHGWPNPPPRVTHAALLLARRWLVDSPVSDRATSLTTEDGTTQFLVTAGVRQAVFDIPEANAVVQQYALNACVA